MLDDSSVIVPHGQDWFSREIGSESEILCLGLPRFRLWAICKLQVARSSGYKWLLLRWQKEIFWQLVLVGLWNFVLEVEYRVNWRGIRLHQSNQTNYVNVADFLLAASRGLVQWQWPRTKQPPGTLVGDKNTTFGPVQDAINLFRYIYIVVYGIYICIMIYSGIRHIYLYHEYVYIYIGIYIPDIYTSTYISDMYIYLIYIYIGYIYILV